MFTAELSHFIACTLFTFWANIMFVSYAMCVHVIFPMFMSYFIPFTIRIFPSQIKPLVGPTKTIMGARIVNYQWHEFFPQGSKQSDLEHRHTSKHREALKHKSLNTIVWYLLSFHISFVAAKNNIGVVIVIWAPVILV